MTRIAALLTHPSPVLRLLVLTRLLGADEHDPEVAELISLREQDPYLLELRALQKDDGRFEALPQRSTLDPVLTTAFALASFGFLGIGTADRAVAAAATYLIAGQDADGSWPLPGRGETGEGYDVVPLQTAIPLRGLCAAGLAAEPAVTRGMEWLLSQRLADGAWPTGRAQGTLGRVAGYRRLPHSRWGCRSNTTGAVTALSLHPELRSSAEARAGLDHLLARETDDKALVGHEVARLAGYTEVTGFFTHFGRFDPAHLLTLAANCGASREDTRVAALVQRLSGDPAGGANGRADGARTYEPLIPCSISPAARHWVTYSVALSLRTMTGDWVGSELRTPFTAYSRRRRT